MKRNVILMGGKTHVISMPLKWIKAHGIKKGDELEIIEENNKITILTENAIIKEPIKLNLEKANASIIVKNITNTYALGYPELELYFKKKTKLKDITEIKTLNVIQDTCDQLIGFEIIDQKETFCRIKDVAGSSINEFKNILRRIFLMVDSFGKETIENINNYEELKNLHRKHITIRKYSQYCQRYLNLRGFKTQTTLYNEIITRLLDISQGYRFITKNQIQKKNKYSKETLSLLKETAKLQEKLHKTFYKFSQEKVTELTENRIEIFKKLNTKAEGAELILQQRIPHILNSILALINTTVAINFNSNK
jgi:phosphate uptake regulator